MERVRRGDWLALGVILAVAVGFRLWGIDFGLPATYHWDERAHLMLALYGASHRGQMLVYGWGTLYQYLLIILYACYYALLGLTGGVRSQLDFLTLYLHDPTPFMLLGRTTMALIGCAGVAAVWLLGWELYGRMVAHLSALLVALAFIHAAESHFIKAQCLATLMLTLCAWQAVRIASRGRLRHYIASGALAGATLALWLLPVGVMLAPLVAHWQRLKAERGRVSLRVLLTTRPLLAPIESAIVTFFLATPYAALDPGRFIGDLKNQADVNPATTDTGGELLWLFFFRELGGGLGWPLALLGVAGFIYMAWRSPRSWPLALPALVNYLVIVNGHIHFARYQIVLLPALAIGAALLLRDAGQRFLRASRFRTPAIAAVALLAAAPSALEIVRFDALASAPDTRTLARQWIEPNLPAHSRIAVEAGDQMWEQQALLGPPLIKDAEQVKREIPRETGLRGLLRQSYLDAHRGHASYEVTNLFRIDRPEVNPASQLYSVDDYVRQGVTYLVTSSWTQWKSGDEPPPAFTRSLNERYELLRSFEPNPVLRHDLYSWNVDHEGLGRLGPGSRMVAGPVVRIYQLRGAG